MEDILLNDVIAIADGGSIELFIPNHDPVTCTDLALTSMVYDLSVADQLSTTDQSFTALPLDFELQLSDTMGVLDQTPVAELFFQPAVVVPQGVALRYLQVLTPTDLYLHLFQGMDPRNAQAVHYTLFLIQGTTWRSLGKQQAARHQTGQYYVPGLAGQNGQWAVRWEVQYNPGDGLKTVASPRFQVLNLVPTLAANQPSPTEQLFLRTGVAPRDV